jgi:hypothetical protein
MAAGTIDISRVVSPEILGPGSEYEKGRLAIKKDWEPIVEAAKAINVTDAETCKQATELGRLLQNATKAVEEFYKPIKQQIDAIKKPVLKAEGEDNFAISTQKELIGDKITVYNAEQRRLSMERERIAREEAERQQREDALQRAIELEASGEVEQSEAVLEEAQHAPLVVTQSTAPPRQRGQVSTTTYGVEILDERKLVEAALRDRSLWPAVKIDRAWLTARAKLDKEGFNIPGCRVTKTESTHFRA